MNFLAVSKRNSPLESNFFEYNVNSHVERKKYLTFNRENISFYNFRGGNFNKNAYILNEK